MDLETAVLAAYEPPPAAETPRRARKETQAGEGLAGTQLDLAKCPLCRQTLVARWTGRGVGFPCGCPGREHG